MKTSIGPNQSIVSEQNLKYWYTVHSALDVIEEKIKKSDFKDLYLGLLYLIEDYRIYGYITNTRIKFLIVIESSNQQYHDTEMKIMFKKLHACYTSCVCNPFYELGQPINSKKFDDLVRSLMQKLPSGSVLSSASSASLAPQPSTANSNTVTSSAMIPAANQAPPSTQKPVEFTI